MPLTTAPCPRHVSSYATMRPAWPSIHKDSRPHHKISNLPLSTQLPPSILSQGAGSSSPPSPHLPSSAPSQYSNGASSSASASASGSSVPFGSSPGTMLRPDLPLRPVANSNLPSQLPPMLSPPQSVATQDYIGYSQSTPTGRDGTLYYQAESPAPTPSKSWKGITSRPLLFPQMAATPSGGVSHLRRINNSFSNFITSNSLLATLLSLTVFYYYS